MGMNQKGFSIGEAVKAGWKLFREHTGFFVALLIVAFIINLIPGGIATYFKGKAAEEHHQTSLLISFIFSFLGYVISLWISMGFIQVSLNIVDYHASKIGDLFKNFSKIFKYFIAQIAYMFILLAGMILLVFPMFIWGTRYVLFPFFIVDKNAGPFEALKLSAKATMGAKWDMLGFWLVGLIINLAGLLCLFIGLFATIPVLLVAHAFVYRKLQTQMEQTSLI